MAHEKPCPSCGYCPTCGRKNTTPPWYPYVKPWWYEPTVTPSPYPYTITSVGGTTKPVTHATNASI